MIVADCDLDETVDKEAAVAVFAAHPELGTVEVIACIKAIREGDGARRVDGARGKAGDPPWEIRRVLDDGKILVQMDIADAPNQLQVCTRSLVNPIDGVY